MLVKTNLSLTEGQGKYSRRIEATANVEIDHAPSAKACIDCGGTAAPGDEGNGLQQIYLEDLTIDMMSVRGNHPLWAKVQKKIEKKLGEGRVLCRQCSQSRLTGLGNVERL